MHLHTVLQYGSTEYRNNIYSEKKSDKPFDSILSIYRTEQNYMNETKLLENFLTDNEIIPILFCLTLFLVYIKHPSFLGIIDISSSSYKSN